MSAWNAINLEQEDDASLEIDDTKEIQLEEAFKIYQNALRLHSLGPSHYQEAREAYQELFDSDVFKYPDALSEYDNDQIDNTSTSAPLIIDAAVVPVLSGTGADNANSLPQLIYLARKSRAQFEIDTARILFEQAFRTGGGEKSQIYFEACKKSLIDAAAALERDDTDLDLWKRASRVSNVLQSIRIVRFCLESVLAGDEEGEDSIDLSGLDEALAKGDLKKLLHLLQDDLSNDRTLDLEPKNALLRTLQQSNDPYPFLPSDSLALERANNEHRLIDQERKPITLDLAEITFTGLADALLEHLEAHNGDASVFDSATSVKLVSSTEGVMATLQPMDMQVDTGSEPQELAQQSSVLNEPVEIDSPASFHSVPENAGPRETSTAIETDADNAIAPKSENSGQNEGDQETSSVALPSRKRSSTAAGNEEHESRTKSKRIKARESLLVAPAQEEEPSMDKNSISRHQLLNIQEADSHLLQTLRSLVAKVHDGFDALVPESHADGDIVNTETNSSEFQGGIRDAANTLTHSLKHWTEEKTAAFMSGQGSRDHVEKSTGLALFQRHNKTNAAEQTIPMIDGLSMGLNHFVYNVNRQSVSIAEMLFSWVMELFTSDTVSRVPAPYLKGVWPEQLKEGVIKVLLAANESIVSTFRLHTSEACCPENLRLNPHRAAELAESVFEVHLERYAQLTSPTSSPDALEREQQMARLQNWADIAADMVQDAYGVKEMSAPPAEPVVLRFLWASITFAKLSERVDKTHILLCLSDLQNVLTASSTGEIHLPNNSIMQTLSPSAVDQEIAKVKTLEFFMSVFDSDNSDAEAVIMKLEPILEYDNSGCEMLSDESIEQVRSFREFLKAGDASLTLFLWKRLQNAYTAISYNTKVVSCLLRSMEIICAEIAKLSSSISDESDRESTMLRCLRDIDDLVTKVLGKIADDKTPFEAIDESHLSDSISTVVALLNIIQHFAYIDDGLRVGDIPAPTFRNSTASKNFEKCRDRFRELYVRLFVLLYWLLKEATVQLPDQFENPQGDLVVYLRTVHGSLGERHYCRYCNKLFVRLAKTEFFLHKDEADVSTDIAQVLYDMYQIRLYPGNFDIDHGCAPESLDRDKKTASALVPIVMDYVKRLHMKDLIKNDIKSTIDKVQAALPQPKASTAASFNRRSLSAYLKSAINPQRLYQCLRGIGELETKPVHGEAAEIAQIGWYFLLGKMTLTKYRSVKRVNPTPTDDLDNAMSYLRQDLEHDASNWESWYRLAQVHDAKIEDNLTWNSNKLNDGKTELATLERNAINAYIMGTALAMRNAPDDLTTTKLINEMCFDFASRLYSSSRPPLNMEAFSTKRAVRHLSNYVTQAMSEEPLYPPVTEYSVWNLAAHLIRKTLRGEAKQWYKYYLLGKCLWKMFKDPLNVKSKSTVTVEDIVDVLVEAVNRTPKRDKSSDPILEPHFKLVTIVHKLVDVGLLSPDQAMEHLQTTPYAVGVKMEKGEDGQEDWQTYVLAVLKKLQNADKSGWHHRITSRAAHIIYDRDQTTSGAIGAKGQFAESIFTKNMTMQVWKPENERAGRHYVYTGVYLRFFIRILDKLNDRSNLEQVVRKIRRKNTDFINHIQVWEDAVAVYVDLLRRAGTIPVGKERALFDNISFDEFSRQSEKLEQWAHDATTTTNYLDIIKDAIEMKKLNNSLSKSSIIDDLIGDAYGCMYETFVSQLPAEEQEPSNPQVSLPQGTFINMTSETAPTGDDNLDRMRLNNLMSAQTDGTSSAAQEATAQTSGLGISGGGVQTFGTTPPPDFVRVPAPAKPGRTKTITRREVQKKAEAAIGKPPPIKTPTLTKRSISVNIPSIKMENSQGQVDDGEDEDKAQGIGRSAASSRRGSVSRRNSADPEEEPEDDEGGDGDNEEDEDEENEADETDIPDERHMRKRMFPGLLTADEQTNDEDETEAEGDQDKGEDESDGGHDDSKDAIEIPNSQEAGSEMKEPDTMDTD